MRLSEIALTMDPVQPAASLRALLGQHRSIPPVTSLSELVRRHTHRSKRTERLLTLNTYLMDVPFKGRKPAVELRDREIGIFTSQGYVARGYDTPGGYDLVTFQEVWHGEERNDLLAEWPNNVHQVSKLNTDRLRLLRRSAGNVGQMTGSSGLLTVSRSLPIVANHFHEYENESGIDKRADKGCLLTVHGLPFPSSGSPSSLNVYSTHLNVGGDNAQYAQIIELVAFIWHTRDKAAGDLGRPGREGLNGSILAGDFNLDRHGTDVANLPDLTRRAEAAGLPREIVSAVNQTVNEAGIATGTRPDRKSGYRVLRDMLTVLGFRDLWATRNGTRGDTSDLMDPSIAALIARRDPVKPSLCDDRYADDARLSKRPQALDHIFVTPTTANMTFTMDFVRPRRPMILRPDDAAELGKIEFLSDHLGISTKIILAPKVE